MYNYEFPRPAVTVDLVALAVVDSAFSVLLIERAAPPFEGKLALPGGFVHEEEPLERTAIRVLDAKARLKDIFLKQVGAFGDPGRDPRGHVISVAYIAVLPSGYHYAGPGAWHPVTDRTSLAFDHERILDVAVDTVRNELQYTNTGLEFLPEMFTLPQMQRTHEAILGKSLDKRNFRKSVFASGRIEPTGKKSRGGPHPPAMIYRRSTA